MSRALLQALERFTEPHDEAQLEQLDKAVEAIRPADCGPLEFGALLGVFERFPEDDGYGVFWSIVHCLEACEGYPVALIESVARAPGEFNLLMLCRLLHSGVTEIEGQSLMSVLRAAASNPRASEHARQSVQDSILRYGQVLGA